MRKYNVTEIANLLAVNKETVRRWIRTGCLTSTITSKKEGYVVDELDLYEFVKTRPKYKMMLGCMGSRVDDTYDEKLYDELIELIKERDNLNRRIDKIQTTILFGEL